VAARFFRNRWLTMALWRLRMDCKTAADLVPLYFDGELDRATSREVEAHLDTCVACQASLIELDALRRVLRHDVPRFSAPDALRRRVTESASVVPSSPGVRRWRSRRQTWIALAASWVLAFAAGGFALGMWHQAARSGEAESQLTRDLFASHWRALASASPIDVVSTDRHTVKPWFAGKVAMAPVVRDFAAQGYALIGGRVDYVGTERVPVLVYRHGKHLIDVFVLSGALGRDDSDGIQKQGYSLENANLGGQRAVIVSDMDRDELLHFRDLLNSTT
jgi:anti-sigma factor RsiW